MPPIIINGSNWIIPFKINTINYYLKDPVYIPELAYYSYSFSLTIRGLFRSLFLSKVINHPKLFKTCFLLSPAFLLYLKTIFNLLYSLFVVYLS